MSRRKITTLFRGEPTADERAAVERLARALAQVPAHLDLFGRTGSLCVVRQSDNDDGGIRPLATFGGIHCDGGDPQDAGDPRGAAPAPQAGQPTKEDPPE